MAEENTKQQEQTKTPTNTFKPKHRVIVPTLVRFDVPVPDGLSDEQKVPYARERVEKIVEALNKRKGGVRAEAEFVTQFRVIK